MPKNNVTDPITDQEIAFACLVSDGTMTDRRAAEAVGLDPDSANYTKSKPRVRAYMLEHRTLQPQPVEKDTAGTPRFSLDRGQILARLWEIANLNPESTRCSITGQVKALSMIVAIEGLIPDRRALAAQNKPAPPPTPPNFYRSAWLRQQEGETVDPHTGPAQEEVASEPQSAPGSADSQPPVSGPTPEPTPDLTQPTFAGPLTPSQTSSVPRVPMADYFAPDTRVPFSININKNPFARRFPGR